MKKLLIVFGLLISSLSVQAQLYIGGKGTVVLPSVIFSPTVSTQIENTVGGQFAIKYLYNDFSGLVLEAGYAEKGFTETSGGAELYRRQLDYFQLNALGDLHTHLGPLNAFLNIGVYAEFLLGETLDENETPITNTGVQLPPGLEAQAFDYATRKANDFRFGIVGGGGLFFPTKIGAFQLEGRVYFGVTNTLERVVQQSAYISNDLSFDISVGYYIPIFDPEKRKK
ncbi:porin family protein [Sediminitomix flava]|uniref:Outer membrane protein with beta-barrel domain n=1 Tax=Sediminitomix flava TaxID=379075 RepID=A0A315ZGQ4_SEDFL|nr:porin family protein [Sediminitomix flava]PWJ44038.1 outer membrane protein with beta-barrel domain [Sediminitomix flava]